MKKKIDPKLSEWMERHAAANSAVYDLHRQETIEAALQAIDIAWRNYTPFCQPCVADKSTHGKLDAMKRHAQRMVLDSACLLAYLRSRAPSTNGAVK